MARLSKQEKKIARRWFEEWRSPKAMVDRSDQLMMHMHDEHGVPVDLFKQGGVDFITEAWAAAVFAEHYGANEVRLIAAKRPDFQTLSGDVVQDWEFTEGMEPGRKRDREYDERSARMKAGDPRRDAYSVKLSGVTADDALSVLRERVADKSDGRYGREVGLVVYLNMGSFDISWPDFEAGILDATFDGKDSFAQIWVLTNFKLYHVWDGGNAVNSVPIHRHPHLF